MTLPGSDRNNGRTYEDFGWNNLGDTPAEGGERGSRRRKLAGYLKAANRLRQSYQQSYRWTDDVEEYMNIPGAFPDVAIARHGHEELILFPSYCRRHKGIPKRNPGRIQDWNGEDTSDAGYWKEAEEKFKSDKAVVDVDVRGWLYSPQKSPLSHKSRILIGIARQLTGVPTPRGNSPAGRDNSPSSSRLRRHEYRETLDQEQINRGAEEFLKEPGERDVALPGGCNEAYTYEDSDSDSIHGDGRNRIQSRKSSQSSNFPISGSLSRKATWNQPSDMSSSELATANANLMTRLMPFLTNPLVHVPVTIFYYNEEDSQSKTVMTDEAGHFSLRASLDFIPTHFRVLASEGLSMTEQVKITESKGVSLISDIDDTIKHTSIGGGAREISRNTLIRDLCDLTIDGVREWYNNLFDMGVGIHYVSNAPWQMFPVLSTFFRTAGLPPGSYHLKQYSGMLQGIFEPVAERKKSSLEKILRDFPERKFLLVGDSGEADLEAYTDIAVANPGRVIGIFIRDVTTPLNQGFFDSASADLDVGLDGRRGSSSGWSGGNIRSSTTSNSPEMRPEVRPALPPRRILSDTHSGPRMGKLIDIEDEPEEINIGEPLSSSSDPKQPGPSQKEATAAIKVPPPRPMKPLALRGLSAGSKSSPASIQNTPPPPLPPRKSNDLISPSQTQNTPELSSSSHNQGYLSLARQKAISAYNALPAASAYLPPLPPRNLSSSAFSLGSTTDRDRPNPLPPRRGAPLSASDSTNNISWNARAQDFSEGELPSYASPPASPRIEPVNKKVYLWKQRWQRAKDILEDQGVEIRTWRTGQDVCEDVFKLVEGNLKEMGVYDSNWRDKGVKK